MTDNGLPAASSSGASPPDGIDISTPVVVKWGATTTVPTDVTFEARRIGSTNSAFFKLRCNVLFKASAPTKMPLYMFIHPERISSLQIADSEADQASGKEEARKKLGSDTVCLRFTLTSPGDLVGPKIPDLTPKNKVTGDVLDALRSLACQDTFTVHLRRNVLSQARLVSLCEVVCSRVLKSISRQADLASLYRGRGGQGLSELQHAVELASRPSSPPSYDELGPSPPLAPLDAPGRKTSVPAAPHHRLTKSSAFASKKRRRSSSDDVTSGKIDVVDVEKICRNIVEQQQAEMLRAVEEKQIKLYDRLLADLKPYISQELDKLEARILDHVEHRISKQAEEQENHVEGRLEDVKDEINDTIQSRIDDVEDKVEDEFYGLRVRLEEFIKDELTEAEERIVEHLESSASISLQFNA